MSAASSRRLPRVRLAALAVAVGSMLLACQQGTTEDEGDDSGLDLINGTSSLPLPSTVRIMDGCTAAKIGPRLLLTAAHCAFKLSDVTPKYDAAHPIRLSTNPAQGSDVYEVAQVHGHPEFLRRCSETLCSISAVAAKLDAPDIAVIELASELAGVPVARIDTRPLAPGDRVILEGFGCTEGVHQADAREVASLTSAEARVVKPEAALHDGSFVGPGDVPVYSGNYVLTPGPGAISSGAGLCPGDSGGPLYARADRKAKGKIKDARDLVIVGVNANYTLLPDADDSVGLPVTNWHTRVDGQSRNAVASWLASIVARPTTTS
jgi:hypothetical protein